MRSHALAKVADSKVTETAEASLRMLAHSMENQMGIDSNIPESVYRILPVENFWEITRGKCIDLPEFQLSCPLARCRFHVQSGMQAKAISKQIPGTDTCVLRVSAGNPHTLEEVGQIFGFTRERSRQIELKALFRIGVNLSHMGVISRSQVQPRRIVQHDQARRKNKTVYEGKHRVWAKENA
jgi:hypothetical protein